jgi:rhodanese-related sulfurtransferase
MAAEKLVALGFTNVTLFEGGLEAWKGSGRSVSRAANAA